MLASRASRTSWQSRVAAFAIGSLIAVTIAPRPAFAQPLNDDCSSATVVSSFPFTDTVDTALATSPASDPPQALCGLGVEDKSVWYEVNLPRAGSWLIHTYGSAYPAAISAYGGGCGAPLEAQCGFGEHEPFRSGLTLAVATATTFLVKITDPGGSGGNLVVDADELPSPGRGIESGFANPLGGAISTTRNPVLHGKGEFSLEATTENVVFVFANGAVLQIASAGDTAPGTGGGTFRTFGPPDLNDGGEVVFRATVDNGTASDGVFWYDGSTLIDVALSGQASPLPGGEPYHTFSQWVDINNLGDIAFVAAIEPVPAFQPETAVFLVSPGSAPVVAASGSDIDPCTGASLRVVLSAGVALNDLGDMAFSGGTGVHFLAGAGVQAAACLSDPAPGAGVGATFSDFPTVVALRNGTDLAVAFGARVQGSATSGEGLFAYAPSLCAAGNLCAVALENDPAPAGHLAFRSFERDVPADFAASGRLAFWARTSVRQGIFVATIPTATIVNPVDEGGGCSIGGPGAITSLQPAMSIHESNESIAYAAGCSLSRGIGAQAPGGGVPSEVVNATISVPSGTGFAYEHPSINTDGEVAARGRRRSAFFADCSVLPCAPLRPIATRLDTVPGVPGQLDEVVPGSLGSDRGPVAAFIARFMNSGIPPTTTAIVTLRNGVLTKITALGDPAPGTGGQPFTNLEFRGAQFLSGSETLIRPGLSKKGTVFLGYTASGAGIWQEKKGTLEALVLQGQAAPSGLGTFDGFEYPVLFKSVVGFLAAIDAGGGTRPRCIFRARSAKSVREMACEGDAIGAPIGGTINEFVAAPLLDGSRLISRVSVNGGTADECYIEARKRTRIRPYFCIGDPLPVGGTLDRVGYESVQRPFPMFSVSKRRMLHAGELSYAGFDRHEVLTHVRLRPGSTSDAFRVAGQHELAPGGGRFDIAPDDQTGPMGFSLLKKSYVLSADLLGASVGHAVFVGP